MHWLYYALLLVVCLAGLAINILGLPGLWVMVVGTLAYAWITHWSYIGAIGLAVLVLLGLIAEVVEFLAGSAGAKAAGASKRGMLGAIIGAIAGAIIGSPWLPVIGTIAGAILGAFAGALLVELLIGKPVNQSLRIGVGAAKGRFLGIVSKTAIGLVMLIITLFLAFPITIKAKPIAPATQPAATTSPATPTTR